jgi:hypothetical protein
LHVDGRLDEESWRSAPWTENFADIEGNSRPKPRFRTRVKMLWDDEHFFLAAELAEPHVQGTFTARDSYIFHEDNDFEVFLDPDGDNHNYGELEMNALNTVWDLRLAKPYRDGGPAEDGWNIAGLQTAVRVDGTINDPSDVDEGWTVEIAIPWSALADLAPKALFPPNFSPPNASIQAPSDPWRVSFSRVEWRYRVEDGKYVRVKDQREDNWTWSDQGAIDMHRPERWAYVQFSTASPGEEEFRPDPAGPAKRLLHRVYYAQRAYREAHGRYAQSLEELAVNTIGDEKLSEPARLEVEGETYVVTAVVRLPTGRTEAWTIRHDSLVKRCEPERH